MTSSICHVVGTDTDVGKTYVTGLLLKLFIDMKISALSAKPVHSGWPDSEEWGEDLELQRQLWSVDASPGQVCAYHFEKPMSPCQAAYIEHRQILPEVLCKWTENLQKISCDGILVEGIGGVCCPLNSQFTYLEYMKQNPAPVLLVGRVGLGSLNHAIMSVRLLQQSGLKVEALVLNEEKKFAEKDLIRSSVVEELERQLDVPIIGPLLRDGEVENKKLLKALAKNLFA